jgi:curved DNA-binding protein CbpA
LTTQAETCYEVMGLPQPTEGAPFDGAALHEAHARLARELHPASNPSRVAAIAHKRMVEAYAVLSDAAKRSAYDASLITPPARVERQPSWVTEKRAPLLSERRQLFEQPQQRAQAPPRLEPKPQPEPEPEPEPETETETETEPGAAGLRLATRVLLHPRRLAGGHSSAGGHSIAAFVAIRRWQRQWWQRQWWRQW